MRPGRPAEVATPDVGRVSWDEPKREKNLRDHQIDFRDVAIAFEKGPTIRDIYDAEHGDQGEDRWKALVWLEGKVVRVSYARRFHRAGEENIRLISAMPGNKKDTRVYWNEFLGEPIP